MPKPLSDGQQRLVFGAVVAVLVAFGIYLSMGGFSGDGDDEEQQRSDDAQRDSSDNRGGGEPATNPPSPIPTTGMDDMDVLAWLPFEEGEFKAAAATAQGFAEAYGTLDYSGSPEEYYSSMEELATDDYAETLQESSGAGALWQEMSEKEAVAEGRANVQSIRSFGDESIVFVVKAQSIVEGEDGADEDLGEFAVTVQRESGEWKVYDFQPADVGNMGSQE